MLCSYALQKYNQHLAFPEWTLYVYVYLLFWVTKIHDFFYLQTRLHLSRTMVLWDGIDVLRHTCTMAASLMMEGKETQLFVQGGKPWPCARSPGSFPRMVLEEATMDWIWTPSDHISSWLIVY